MAENPGDEMRCCLSPDQNPTLHQYDTNCETLQQRFRRFQYTETIGPREMFNQLWELCHQWLQPDVNSVEQILEMLVLEQFLTVLPSEIESRVSALGPENRETLFSLIEDIQREQKSSELQVDKENMHFEELMPLGMEPMLQDEHQEPPAPQVLELTQEIPVMEVWMLEPGQQEQDYGTAAESQNLLEPGLIILLVENTAEENTKQIQGEENAVGEASEEIAFPIPESELGAWSCPMGPGEELWMELGPDYEFMEKYAIFEQACKDVEEFEQLEPPREPPVEELLSVCPDVVNLQRPYALELPQISSQEVSVKPKHGGKKRSKSKHDSCSLCGQRFGSEKELSGHMKIHAREIGHQCTLCGEGFFHQSDLDRHQCIHMGEGPYKCSLCHMTFTETAHLSVHQKRHCKKNVYECSECKRKFSRWCSLEKHLRIHKRRVCNKCTICGKAFTRRATLTMHQRTHTGERPFSCEYCGKRYRQKSSLIVHLRTHTGETPYKCSQCSQSFMKRASFAAHQISHIKELSGRKSREMILVAGDTTKSPAASDSTTGPVASDINS